MSYRYSQIDKRNLKWFCNDYTSRTLLTIMLESGQLRGLQPFRVNFSYPISAIAGENGSGKSTLLAMTACAFHNEDYGYRPSGSNRNYYTFSDYFIQTAEESPPSGVVIKYQFLHNNWKHLKPGPGWQARRKPEGGKWNNYERRICRNVIYFGVNRVVPHFERSAYRSYRKRFSPDKMESGDSSKIMEIAGRVFGKTYSSYTPYSHSKYRLPVVAGSDADVKYSGFNMGAGECAVFDILTSLFEAGKGTLLVIDRNRTWITRKCADELR